MARAFERPAAIALPDDVGEGLALEGLYVPADAESEGGAARGAVIAPPHPLMGGSMESPVVTEIAWACQRAGRSSLRFNWRGVGASAGRPSGDAGDADVDYASAVRFVLDTVPGPWMACGYSYGALAALRASRHRPAPERLLLVAPPTGMLDVGLLTAFAGEALVVAGREDTWFDAAALSAATIETPRIRVEVIPDCDHFFMTGLGQLARVLADWLGQAA
jgi:alpha/beta superfamily hydrolase